MEVRPGQLLSVTLAEASHDLQILVLCSEGYTSSLAAYALQQLGVRRATDIIGGFQAWLQAGLPTIGGSSLTVVRDRQEPDPPADGENRPAHGDLLLDRDRRRVRVGDREIDLTRMEFDVLAHLLDSPQRVHTRHQLLDALWRPRLEGGSRTVDVHVHRLRAKLRSPWAESLTTVRGVGYGWAPPTS